MNSNINALCKILAFLEIGYKSQYPTLENVVDEKYKNKKNDQMIWYYLYYSSLFQTNCFHYLLKNNKCRYK